jgi:hypothetical protein
MTSVGAARTGVAAAVPTAPRTRRALLAKAGLVAGSVTFAALQRPAPATAALRGSYEIQPPAGSPAIVIEPTGAVSPSITAGGALNLDNSGSTGAGAVLHSDRGADALGRLLVVNQTNAANPQHAVRIYNAGTAHTVSILHDPGGGAGDNNALGLDLVSTNPLDTTLGVRGREEHKGTVKITHEKPSGDDSNAAAISIALRGAGTGCQGIYIGNDAGDVTTGSLLHIRNGGPGAERLVLGADGRLELAGDVVTPGVQLADATGNARIFVSGGKLVVEWTDGTRTLYTTIPLDSAGPYPAAAPASTDTVGP